MYGVLIIVVKIIGKDCMWRYTYYDVFGLLKIPNTIMESHWTIYENTFDNESYRIIPKKNIIETESYCRIKCRKLHMCTFTQN